MVLIAESAIIGVICVMIVFNKAKYHICEIYYVKCIIFSSTVFLPKSRLS